MSEPESELLAGFRTGYEATHEAFNRHDMDEAFGALPEDIEWRTIQAIPGAPEVCRGRDEVIAFFRDILNEWPDWHTELLSFGEPQPGLVVVEFRAHGTGRTSGIPLSGEFAQVWDLRDRPVRVTEFANREAAREHIGCTSAGA